MDANATNVRRDVDGGAIPFFADVGGKRRIGGDHIDDLSRGIGLHHASAGSFTLEIGPIARTARLDLGFGERKRTTVVLDFDVDAVQRRVGIGGRSIVALVFRFDRVDDFGRTRSRRC